MFMKRAKNGDVHCISSTNACMTEEFRARLRDTIRILTTGLYGSFRTIAQSLRSENAEEQSLYKFTGKGKFAVLI